MPNLILQPFKLILSSLFLAENTAKIFVVHWSLSLLLVANSIIFVLGDQMSESKDLNRFLTDYCKHWRATGLQLGLKSSVLDQVEADYLMSECFRVTLEKWLQLNVGVTWANL